MAKKENEDQAWYKPSGPRTKVPPVTDEMVIKNQDALKKQKEGQKSSGKLFWEKKK